MTASHPRARFLLPLLLAACATLAACSTPKPVLEMASQGAVVVDRSESEVRTFIDRATQAYRRREAIVQDLAAGDIGDRSKADFDGWLAGEAGYPNDRANALLIKKIAEESRATRERQQAEHEKKAKEISDAFGDPVQVPEKELAAAKKAFLVLAQELSSQEWLAFGFRYAKQVRTDLKALEAEPAPPAGPAAPTN